ncbi:hypothetical protein FHL01_10370 [Cylindrospermopsis raciborskii CS-506_C]|nr:hypothetical protein [Cylindrospermopsis raciborskii]MBA4445794.1 hypothetical protein [Cylindrospermopsis raciborskii CS-506_C]
MWGFFYGECFAIASLTSVGPNWLIFQLAPHVVGDFFHNWQLWQINLRFANIE